MRAQEGERDRKIGPDRATEGKRQKASVGIPERGNASDSIPDQGRASDSLPAQGCAPVDGRGDVPDPVPAHTEAPGRGFSAVGELLSLRHPGEDPAHTARALEQRFASPTAMLGCGPHLLARAGLHPHDALLVSVLGELDRIMEYERPGPRPQLGRLALAAKYLVNTFYGINVERFCMLCLDGRGRLTARVLLGEGSEDAAVFDLRRMLEAVARRSPDCVVLAHNHPGGTLRPSRADIDCTEAAVAALGALGMPLLDHIILSGERAVSIRANGFLPPEAWIRQAPEHPILLQWLSTENLPPSSLCADGERK